MALDLAAIRRQLHENPELSHQEYKTAKRIEKTLAQLGLSPVRRGKTGVTVDIGDGPAKDMVAFRADIDALPIKEETGAGYASKRDGVMHACGHDAHTAIALGVAEALVARKGEFAGKRMRILFQPAEEALDGATDMIQAGALDGVGCMYALHNKPDLAVGKIAVCNGPAMAACARFTIRVRGKGGHGASPHLTRDPVAAAAAVISGAQAIGRRISAIDPVVLSVCTVHGGTAFNIIPQDVELTGTARYLSDEVRSALPQLLVDMAKNVAAGYGCSAVVEFQEFVPPLGSDSTMLLALRSVGKRVLGEENVVDLPGAMTSEDFAEYGKSVPICFFWLGSGGTQGFHHPQYDLDEACMPVGVRLVTETMLATLKS